MFTTPRQNLPESTDKPAQLRHVDGAAQLWARCPYCGFTASATCVMLLPLSGCAHSTGAVRSGGATFLTFAR